MGNPFSQTYEDISKNEDSLAFEEDFRDILEQLEDIVDINSEEDKTQLNELKAAVIALTGDPVEADAEAGTSPSKDEIETSYPWEASKDAEISKAIIKEVFAIS